MKEQIWACIYRQPHWRLLSFAGLVLLYFQPVKTPHLEMGGLSNWIKLTGRITYRILDGGSFVFVSQTIIRDGTCSFVVHRWSDMVCSSPSQLRPAGVIAEHFTVLPIISLCSSASTFNAGFICPSIPFKHNQFYGEIAHMNMDRTDII